MIQTHSTSLSFDAIPLVVPSAVARRYPMQAAQLEVWLSSQQSDAANCAYNEIATISLGGQLDRSALESALQSIFQRHGSLRATFDRQGDEVAEQPVGQLEIEYVDWQGTDPQQIPSLRKQLIDQLGTTPFDLQHGPLFRAILQRAAATQHFMTISAHHLVLDGWSLSLIAKELGLLYDQFKQGTLTSGSSQHSATPAPAYADYAQAMQQHAESEAGTRELNYWLEQFADGAPTLDLPLSGSRSALRSYAASRIEHVLPAQLVASVRKLGAKNGCSLYNTMLAAFQAFVARLGQTDDLVLAIPTAGQAAMDLPGLVGHCVNTLPLRIRIDREGTFKEHLKRSRSALLSGLEHQRFSFGTLLKHLKSERDPSRPPLCAISFNLDPIVDMTAIGFIGLDVSLQIEPRAYENFEWFVNGIIHADQSIELQVQFNRDLYHAEMLAYTMEGFQAYLDYLVQHPEAQLSEVPMMSLRQRQTMMVDWNATQLDYPTESNLAAEFSRQAGASPDKIAVRAGGETLTYRELDQQSSSFAGFLAEQGVRSGDLVGICTPRSSRLLVQVLGILKAGAGYVPLDPHYPTERLRHMCDDSGLKLIVSERELATTVAAFDKTIVLFDDFAQSYSANTSSATIKSTIASTVTIAPANICYVIYTSGSTGKPKGVMVPHGSVVNFLYSMKECPGYESQDNVLAVTTLSFDIAVLELYLPLIFGGTVVIADWATATDGKKLIDAIEREDIGLMQATPATWRMMIASGWNGKEDLKILCGGEPMTSELAELLLQRCAQLWNMYGPTETTVWSTAYRIESASAPISIGRPIGNTQIYLLDAHGQEVPVGVEGEVMIGGAGVTLGYRNRPDLTSDRFVDNPYFNPFADYINHRLYKTGDLAVYRLDGNIEYRRRNDKQIKLRGFRIELGEIEAAICSFVGIGQAVALVRNDQPGDSRLVAYVTANGQLSVDKLREHLRTLLPHYMIPQNFVTLGAMPLTDNGKVNAKALPAPEAPSTEAARAACSTPAEKYLESLWKKALQLDSINRNDNFFDVGGHSLLVMHVINEVEAFTHIRLSPQEFLLGTLEQLATQLDECGELAEAEAIDASSKAEQTPSGNAYSSIPLSTHSQTAPIETQALPSSRAALAAVGGTPSKSPFDCLKRFWS